MDRTVRCATMWLAQAEGYTLNGDGDINDRYCMCLTSCVRSLLRGYLREKNIYPEETVYISPLYRQCKKKCVPFPDSLKRQVPIYDKWEIAHEATHSITAKPDQLQAGYAVAKELLEWYIIHTERNSKVIDYTLKEEINA